MKLSNINKHFFPELEEVNQSFIYLNGEIDGETTGPIIKEIIAANMEDECECSNPEECECDGDREDVINVLINSGGGSVADALSLITVMEASEIPIRTIALGECGSAALMILMAGQQRVVTRYSSLLSHQFWTTGVDGSYSDLRATMVEFNNYHEKIVSFYEENTGLDRDTINTYLLKDTDTWLTPFEAIDYNIADIVCDLK